MPSAVEELLRYDSPVQRTGRIVLEDLELNGRFYAQGQRVNMLVGAANRDPEQFADPDRLDVTRKNASQHLSFAAGIHYCVGAPLARLEAQLAIAALLRRYSQLRMLDAKLAWRPTFVLRGYETLPVALAAEWPWTMFRRRSSAGMACAGSSGGRLARRAGASAFEELLEGLQVARAHRAVEGSVVDGQREFEPLAG
jgi:hypothetical protein